MTSHNDMTSLKLMSPSNKEHNYKLYGKNYESVHKRHIVNCLSSIVLIIVYFLNAPLDENI